MGLADVQRLLGRVRIGGGSERGGGRHLAEEHADERCGPRLHVELCRHLRQRAGHVAPCLGNVGPQRRVAILRGQHVRLAEIGERLRQRAGEEICPPAIFISKRALWIEADGLVKFRDASPPVARSQNTAPRLLCSSRGFGIEADRLIVVGDGGVELALFLMHVSSVYVGWADFGARRISASASASARSRSPFCE